MRLVRILNLFRKLGLIIFLFLITTNIYSASIPYINQVPLLDSTDQVYEVWVVNNNIRKVLKDSEKFHDLNEIYGYKILKVDFNFVNSRIVSHLNRTILFLNSYLKKINDKLQGQTDYKFGDSIFSLRKNIHTLTRIVDNINSLITNWMEHSSILYFTIPRCFEELYFQEDILLNCLDIDHASFYTLKQKGCVFFERLKYAL